MNFDFYANDGDKLEILNFIFSETELQVYDCYSEPQKEVMKYESTEDIVNKFDLVSGNKFAVTFKLYSSNFKGDFRIQKINLNPKYCNGNTYRYTTTGWGLIQLYFGGLEKNELRTSHIGHQSKQRAITWQKTNPELGLVDKWCWEEVERTGRFLRYQINKRFLNRKLFSYSVLNGANELSKSGIVLK